MKLNGKMNLAVVSISPLVVQTLATSSFFATKSFTVKKKIGDENGRMLILQALTYDSEFILINFYIANTESEQLKNFYRLK